MAESSPTRPRKEINRNPRRDLSRLSSVTTAVHLLKTFNENEVELGISELAKRLGVAKSTIHRLAGALLEEGLLQQNEENGRYSLGIGLFALGSLVRSRLDIASESKTHLNDLREKTQENVRLAVLNRQNIVLLHDFESPQTLRLRSGTGQFKPAFCTAEGICLLTRMSDDELDEFFTHPRKARTTKTVTDEAEIRAKIKSAKSQGYALEDEECDEGTRCIAAPIYNSEGRIVAAIGVAGPRVRIRKRQFSGIVGMTLETAEIISRRLGYNSHSHLSL